MPTVREVFPPNFLKAEDLKGKDVTLTIASWKREGVPKPPSFKPEPAVVIEFAELRDRHAKDPVRYPKNTRWILGKLNAAAIATHHGGEMDNWIGKKITLYPGRARNPQLNKDGPAIKVRKKGERGGKQGGLPEDMPIDPERFPDAPTPADGDNQ
jgi:hypothetical protein